jgi:hypothetical protein
MQFKLTLDELIEAKGASTSLEIEALEAWIGNETYAPDFNEVWDEIEDWIQRAEEAYIGKFDSGSEFAEHLLSELCISVVDEEANIAEWVVIDYQATWECYLRHEYNELDGFYFRTV